MPEIELISRGEFEQALAEARDRVIAHFERGRCMSSLLNPLDYSASPEPEPLIKQEPEEK